MSRGPGWVERTIAALFEGDSEAAFTVEELCEQVYGKAREPQHRIVVARAGKNLIGRGANLAWFRWSLGRGSQLVLYVPDNVMSYAKARIKSDPIPHGGTLEDALARHADYLQPGGVWWRYVEIHKAERAGDTERVELLRKQSAENLDQLAERLRTVGA